MLRVILALAVAVVLAAALVACGGSGDSSAPAAAASSAAPTSAAPEPSATQSSMPGGPSNAELAQLYADNCSGCHGADGNGGSAPSILGEDDLAKVQTQIENGGGPMPAFSSKLQPGQILMLAQYVVDGLPQ